MPGFLQKPSHLSALMPGSLHTRITMLSSTASLSPTRSLRVAHNHPPDLTIIRPLQQPMGKAPCSKDSKHGNKSSNSNHNTINNNISSALSSTSSASKTIETALTAQLSPRQQNSTGSAHSLRMNTQENRRTLNKSPRHPHCERGLLTKQAR